METTPASAASARAPIPQLRLHGLDTLRGLSAILVVLLHAGIPYMLKPMQHAVWPAVDAHPSSIVDGLVWWIECFIMPLFFTLTGFFSAGLLALHGRKKFLAHRTQRILYPQLAFAAVLLPACIYLWALGWVADGLFIPTGYFIPGIPPELEVDLWGTAHLWFLQNLYLYALALCVAHFAWSRLRGTTLGAALRTLPLRREFDRALLSEWKPLLPAIPCALILFWDPRIVLGFYQTFIPVASKFIYYGIYFFVGVFLHRYHRSLPLLVRHSQSLLLTAAASFAALLPMIHAHLETESTGWKRVALASLLALFAWSMTFGLFGYFLKNDRGYNRATRFLGEASYWVYLVHLPIVALTQIAFARLNIPAGAKFCCAASVTVALCLASYEVFARYTWLGEFLNGTRRKRPVAEYGPAILPLTARAAPVETPSEAAHFPIRRSA